MKKKIIAMALIIAVMFTIIPTAGTTAEAAGKRPAKVTGVKVKQSGTKKLKITWKKAKYAKKYVVYQKKGAGKWKRVKTTKKRSYTTKNLSKNVTYKFKVKARNSRGYSKKYSTTKSGYIKASTFVPDPTGNNKVDTSGISTSELSKITNTVNSQISNNLSPTKNTYKNAVEIYPNAATYKYLANGLGAQDEFEGYDVFMVWDINVI